MTGYTLITASKIQDGSGHLLASGRVSCFPTNNLGDAVSATAYGGGLITSTPVVFLVVNGAITTDLYGNPAQLADTTLTTPANICWNFTVTDATGEEVQGPGYGLAQPSGTTWSLDNYVPNQPLLATIQTGPGFTYRGVYSSGTVYAAGDVVTYAGSSFVSLAGSNLGNTPATSTSEWGVLAAAGSGGSGGGASFAAAETFTGVQTKNIVHGLGTLTPAVDYYPASSNPGATAFRQPVPVDPNTTAITSIASASGTFVFVGGTSSGGGSTPVAPSFTVPPTNQSGLTGSTITFTATSTGTPTPTYQWQTDSGTGGATWTNISGATSASYSFTAAGQNGYRYRRVDTNSAGSATSASATVTITIGPAADWAMTDGSGSTFVDSVAGNNMTISGPGSGWGTWLIPSTYLFNGGAYASAPAVPSCVTGTAPWTIEFWSAVGTMPSGGANGALFGNTANGSGGVAAYFVSGSTELIAVLYGPGGSAGGQIAVVYPNAFPAINVRHLVSITYDGSGTAAGLKIYIDGVSGSSTVVDSLGGASIASANPFAVGGASYSPSEVIWKLNCVLDHFIVYPYAKTSTQVAARYAGGV